MGKVSQQFICIYLSSVYMCTHMVLYPCGAQRTTGENWFSPPTMWDPGIELK